MRKRIVAELVGQRTLNYWKGATTVGNGKWYYWSRLPAMWQKYLREPPHIFTRKPPHWKRNRNANDPD